MTTRFSFKTLENAKSKKKYKNESMSRWDNGEITFFYFKRQNFVVDELQLKLQIFHA